ncbi:serine hydrolase domain-containing protein [Chitinophaga barathri]|uniref:Class A beta-lactamase-related serine hydrolase n=1 Tax=Chitinophaga barathri TaxID=1647451 RepID=A0A3N4MPG7_9BACT|nr:serine hydrolase domain-containing protein [Chitinophaga barathri]RPD41559.1 class A beta-lactamase-related serine hydrolase [Chitinophaga barathri]
MKTVFLFLASVLIIMPCMAQQPLKPATNAAEAGFSAERLARIDSFFNDAIAKGYAPNAVTFIAHNGRIVHNKAYGYSNIEKKTPARTDDFFRIASQTKLVTTIAVLMLYEEGKLFLDDPVAKFLPEFRDMQVLDSVDKTTGQPVLHKAKKMVTIRHLLSHTAGIPYQHPTHKVPGGALSDLDGLTLDSLIRQVAARPLVHEPGEKFTYGYNTDIAGRVVEVISGQNLSDFFASRIFKPLGMKDSYFYLPASKAGRLVELYSKGRMNDPITLSGSVGNRTFPIGGKQTLFLGGAGLVCTASDYAIICQLILNGGSYNNVRLLSRKTVDLMGRNQIGDNFVWDRNDKFGLGFQIITDDTRYGDQASPGSLTWGGAYCSEHTIDKKEGLIMLVFTNVSPYAWYGDFVRKFRVLTYGALE